MYSAHTTHIHTHNVVYIKAAVKLHMYNSVMCTVHVLLEPME
jgi:hypothetical protein